MGGSACLVLPNNVSGGPNEEDSKAADVCQRRRLPCAVRRLGGASYAATKLPKNSVGSKQIKKNAVNAAKLKKSSVNSAKVKDHSLQAVDFKAGQLPQGAEGRKGRHRCHWSTRPGRSGDHRSPAYDGSGSVGPVGGSFMTSLAERGT